MAVPTFEVAGKKFVVVEESVYRKLRRRARLSDQTAASRLSAQDIGDIAEAKRRMKEKGFVTLEEVKKKLGL